MTSSLTFFFFFSCGGISSTNGHDFSKEFRFIHVQYDLSEHCELGTSREENIRDRIVVGILEKELSHELQLMADLRLAQARQPVRQAEEVMAQVSLQGDTVGSVQGVQQERKKQHH